MEKLRAESIEEMLDVLKTTDDTQLVVIATKQTEIEREDHGDRVETKMEGMFVFIRATLVDGEANVELMATDGDRLPISASNFHFLNELFQSATRVTGAIIPDDPESALMLTVASVGMSLDMEPEQAFDELTPQFAAMYGLGAPTGATIQ